MQIKQLGILIAKRRDITKLLNKISENDDQQAFRELFDLYHSWLFTVAYTIVHSHEDAEEILEDVFVKIWEIRDRYHQIDNIETYLYVAIKNKSYDLLRKQAKFHHIDIEEDLIELDFMESPEDTFLYQELNAKIEDSIQRLPPKCKEIYLLIKESGNSYKETARILEVSQKTVESQMRIAIKRIASDINDYLASREKPDRNAFLLLSIHLLV